MSKTVVKDAIIRAVDMFYLPIIGRFMPRQTFRYGVCGGVNLLFDALLYFLFFNYIFCKQDLSLPFGVVVSSEIASFLVVFPITFCTGFWLSKYVSFENNSTKTVEQSVKYLMVVLLNIIVKYSGIKLLVLYTGLFPSVINLIMSGVTVVISYILQRNFTFNQRVN